MRSTRHQLPAALFLLACLCTGSTLGDLFEGTQGTCGPSCRIPGTLLCFQDFDTAGGGNNQSLLYHCCVQPLYLPQGACSAAGRRRQIEQQAAGSVSAALLNPAGCLRSAPVPQAAAPKPTRSTQSGAPALAGAHGQPTARPAGAVLSQALQAHAADSPLRCIARRQLRAAGNGTAPASPAYLGSALQAVVIVAILCACGLPAVRRWSRRSWCALLPFLGYRQQCSCAETP